MTDQTPRNGHHHDRPSTQFHTSACTHGRCFFWTEGPRRMGTWEGPGHPRHPGTSAPAPEAPREEEEFSPSKLSSTLPLTSCAYSKLRLKLRSSWGFQGRQEPLTPGASAGRRRPPTGQAASPTWSWPPAGNRQHRDSPTPPETDNRDMKAPAE